jgi:transcription initiation factor TFIIH subunit 3
MFYASDQEDEGVAEYATDSNMYRPFKVIDSTLVTRILHEVDALGQPDSEGAHLAPLFNETRNEPLNRTMWTCWCPNKIAMLWVRSDNRLILIRTFKLFNRTDINRLLHQPNQLTGDDSTTLPDPRILILSVSPDLSNSYIPIMNSIFSAQKLVRGLSLSLIRRSTGHPR